MTIEYEVPVTQAGKCKKERWKQVRRMTGVLVEVGRGNISPVEVATFFKIKTDVPTKLTALPSGLFLEKVYYKKEEISYETKPVINM